MPSAQQAEFPHTFPSVYAKLLVIPSDVKKMALSKLAKVLHFVTFQCPSVTQAELLSVTAPVLMRESLVPVEGFNCLPVQPVKQVAVELVLFLQSVRPFLYPSNTGAWTAQLAHFLTTVVTQMTRHLGRSIALSVAGPAETQLQWLPPLHMCSLRYVSGSLLALLVEGLYGKNSIMTQYWSLCLKNLVVVDPNIGDVLLPFLLSALDVSAVNQSHQGEY